MAVVEEALVYLLTNHAALAGIVKNRVHPVVMPDNPEFPCITYQRTSAVREHRLEGKGNLTISEFTIDVWAQTEPGGMAQVSEAAAQVRACLDGLRNTIMGVDIQSILSLNETDIYESEVEVFRRSMRFRVIFRE